MSADTDLPAFARELNATLPVHAQFILWGKHDDLFAVGAETGPQRAVGLTELLVDLLMRNGYAAVISHDLVNAPVLWPDDATAREVFTAVPGMRLDPRPPNLDMLRQDMTALAFSPRRVAAIVDLSDVVTSTVEPQAAERLFFRQMSRNARIAPTVGGVAPRPAGLYNAVIWLVGNESELPVWFTTGNDNIRSIPLPQADLGSRLRVLETLIGERYQVSPAEAAELAARSIDQTDGLSIRALVDVVRLAGDRQLAPSELATAIRIYKFGVPDNPWRRDHLRAQLRAGQSKVEGRVLGQPRAVTRTLDMLKRAVLGLTGAQTSRQSGRPRGVLFFAGPTGVGKTEMAKAVAELIFGDENAMSRFDMSEFALEHQGERLIGAPPGFVGHEAGGQLTNSVRQNPFQVILFDEIEKSHPRILDKFLQILEDGRLTDGRGGTVLFSECVLIFTSNLGSSDINPGTPYLEVDSRVRAAVAEHFVVGLGRPELLNRLGDNIVVFDFISPEAADRIADLQLANILRTVREETGVQVVINPVAQDALRRACTRDLTHGARGIGSILESLLVNQLARHIFDAGLQREATVVVAKVTDAEGGGAHLELA